MNPDFLADDGADFRLDAFNEAPANPVEFIGWPDRGGNFQRGLFHFAPAKVRSGVDAFQCVRHFTCFHNLFLCLRRRFIQRHHYFIRRNFAGLQKLRQKPCKYLAKPLSLLMLDTKARCICAGRLG